MKLIDSETIMTRRNQPNVTSSHSKIPNDQTSDADVKTHCCNDSHAIHRTGSGLRVVTSWALASATSRADPKSEILQVRCESRRTLRAARSRCNNCAKTLDINMRRVNFQDAILEPGATRCSPWRWRCAGRSGRGHELAGWGVDVVFATRSSC